MVRMEYLGIMPGIEDNVGVGVISLRSEDGNMEPITLQRAALERLQEDIETLLRTSPALNTDETIDQAAADRVLNTESVLDQFGFFDFQYQE